MTEGLPAHQQKIKALSVISLLISGFALYSLFSCNQNQEGNFGYGKQYYLDNCLACHNYRSTVEVSRISLAAMNNFDSSSLKMRLVKLKEDDYHMNYLSEGKYSDKEINSLLIYIKSYYESPYNP